MPEPIDPTAANSGARPAAGEAKETMPAVAAESVSGAVGAPMAWPRLVRVDDVEEAPAPVAAPTTPSGLPPWLTWVAIQACGFGLLLGGYFLGRAWSPPARVPPGVTVAKAPGGAAASTRVANERALDAANRALDAERRRDYAGARQIYEDILKRPAPLPGAEYRLALLSLHEGDYQATEMHLGRSVRAGDQLADCELLRASLAGMKGDYAGAASRLAAAVRAQPFEAKLYFCWGEALRRAGQVSDGIARIELCLLRPDNDTARTLYIFKLRLAQVESGGNEATNAAITAHVNQPEPAGDWLLLAAAQEIGRRDFGASARRLEQARDTLPPTLFNSYVQDYFFQAHRERPELAELLRVPPPMSPAPAEAPLEDPAAWTAAEADPAVWPPFTQAQ